MNALLLLWQLPQVLLGLLLRLFYPAAYRLEQDGVTVIFSDRFHGGLSLGTTVFVHSHVYTWNEFPLERVTDTMLVAVTDTLRLHDTTFVQLPRTEREYADSTYRAVVSGYDPKLERIEVYRQTLEVTKTVTLQDPRRWSLGIQAGVGVGLQGLTPYLGVGVSYDLLRF